MGVTWYDLLYSRILALVCMGDNSSKSMENINNLGRNIGACCLGSTEIVDLVAAAFLVYA